jgi:hypothetical protein
MLFFSSGAGGIVSNSRFEGRLAGSTSTASTGISVQGTASPIINNSAFISMGTYALSNTGTSSVDARNNWWGASSGPSGLGGGTGFAAQGGNVVFDPWLGSEPPLPTAQAQTITFNAIADQVYGAAPLSLSATASSGLPVTFSLLGGPATLSGGTLTITGAGTVIVRASQAGNTSYSPATSVDRSIIVAKATASVALSNLTRSYSGSPQGASVATTPAGLTVDVTYQGSATVPTNAGSYSVAADINDANYQGTASGTLVIAKADQTISFATLADRVYGDAAFALSATSTSGLPVSFSIFSGPATLTGNAVTLTGTGHVTVRATQSGNANYNPATAVDLSFLVAAPTADFASWSASRFTEAELANPAISGPNADVDLDGFSNLVEYALGLEPRQPSTAGVPEVGVTATDWTYTYTRPADRDDLNYEVEASINLTTWSSIGVTLERITSGTTETWQASYPRAGTAQLFFRLKVTTLP